MTVWLINPYGVLPGEDGWRDTRSTVFCRTLADRGHQVTWWASKFSHTSKAIRPSSWDGKEPYPGFTIRLISSPTYKNHVSLGRLYFELAFALRSYLLLRRLSPPDIIISNDPPQIPALSSGILARGMKVPLLLDVIDLWPELFATALPASLRRFSRLIFWPLFAIRRRNLRQASAVTAVCDSYGRAAMSELSPGTSSKVETIFWGLDLAQVSAASNAAGTTTLPRRDQKGAGEVWAVYSGMLGQRYDLDTILGAAKLAKTSDRLLRFIIAGDGPRKEYMQAKIASDDLHNVLFLGMIPAASLTQLYRLCDIGLCAYSAGSTVAMPVKVFDYFAAGLPVVNSLEGDIKDILRDNGAGLKYRAGDAESLLGCVRELVNSQQLRCGMAKRSRALAQRFDTPKQYGRFAEIVEKVARDYDGQQHSRLMASRADSN